MQRKKKRRWASHFRSFLLTDPEFIQGNVAYRKGDYEEAVKLYEMAHEIESELPHYQLNLAAAHLKLNKYVINHRYMRVVDLISQLDGGREGLCESSPTAPKC